MIRSSNVSLLIPCQSDDEARAISAHLGVEPTEVRRSKGHLRQPDGTMADVLFHAWSLESPVPTEGGGPTARLWALIEVIRPFADRLATLDAKWKRSIDIIYHVTPQRPEGMTAEFNWFHMPATMMKVLGEWQLDVSYEVFWHNHPEWRPPRRSLWSRIRRLGDSG